MKRSLSLLVVLAFLGAAVAVPSAVAQQQEDEAPGAKPGPGPGPGPAPGPDAGPGCDPSFGGKYRGLQRRIAVPGDARTYGACKDYGRWSGNSYRGYTDLPNGYWTYAAPHWYIWAEQAGGSACDPSMSGKYTGFQRRLYVPQDQAQYGACRDYGRWAGNSYRGHTDLPNGYWTYVAPYWYIWANRTQ